MNTPNHAQVVPFFVLNHQLDAAHLRQFVRDCAAAGVDGIFLHPREGLLTPYLSEAWFTAIGTCIAEAKKAGIKAWLYDEFPYPSGVAGGKVVASNPAFAERHLRVTRQRLKGPTSNHLIILGPDEVLGAFLLPIRNGQPQPQQAIDITAQVGPFNDTWIKRKWDSRYYYAPKYAKLYDCPRSTASHPQAVFEGDIPAGQWELVVFFVRTGGDFVEPFGHYVDVSNRAATDTFIRITHEQYRQRFGREFGKTVPGFFTDEPKYRNMLPWSEAIAEQWEDFRQDRRALLALAERDMAWPFAQRGLPMMPKPKLGPLNSRADSIRCRYRLHAMRLFRDNWAAPISDWCTRQGVKLTGHISPEEEWVQEAAVCGSIAQILKKFHIPGCDLIIPAVGDREHPILNFIPSLAVSVAAQQGKPQTLCEVFGANNYQLNTQDVKRITDWLASFGINLFVNHGLFGWIDGYRKYDAPPTFYKPSQFWPHFKDWADQVRITAGRLGPLGARARIVIARPMRNIWRLGLDREADARAVFEQAMQIVLSLQERGHLFHWVDDLDLHTATTIKGRIQIGRARYDHIVYFSQLMDAEASKQLRRLKRGGASVLTETQARHLPGPLQSTTGNIRVTESTDGGWFCLNVGQRTETFTLNGQSHQLEGYESRWIEPNQKAVLSSFRTRIVRLSPDWNLEPVSENLVVLQQWTLNGKKTEPAPYYDVAPKGEIGALDQVSLGQIPTHEKMSQSKRLVYRTRFHCQNVRSVKLVIEGETVRGEWSATFNGHPLSHWKKNYRFDATNRELELKPRNGSNELVFTVTINKSSDGMIEPCRLYGNFRVKRITPIPHLVPAHKLHGSGDWTRLGFPHYTGIMRHTQEFDWKKEGKKVELLLNRPPSDQVVVKINGRTAGKLLWSPWALDITKHLRPGRNQLTLEVSNTLMNLVYGTPRRSGLNAPVTLRVHS